MTQDQLPRRVWGQGHSGGPGPVRTCVKRLRRKPGDDADNPTHIFNEPRLGYRMERGGRRRKGGHHNPVRVRLTLTALNDSS